MKIQINATNINIKIDDGRGNTLLEVQTPAYKLDCDVDDLAKAFTELADLIIQTKPGEVN